MPLIVGLGDFQFKDPLGLYNGQPGLGAPKPAPKEQPATSPTAAPNQPPQQRSAPAFSSNDWNDMVNTVIAEAGGDGEAGMVAVASVIKNRADRRGQSPADVVRAPNQFEGYSNPGAGSRAAQNDTTMRQKADAILRGVFDGSISDNTGGADHFYSGDDTPDWANKMQATTRIGGHNFFTSGQKPRAGAAAALDTMAENPAGQSAPNPDAKGLARLVPPEDNIQASDFLKTRLVGHTADHIDGMKPELQSRLMAMFEAAPPEIAADLGIFSGARSVERQTQLWNAALKKYGSVSEARRWVAPPPGVAGSKGSRHNMGEAADLSYKGKSLKHAPQNVLEWVHQNAGQYGLSFPLGNEPWHIEVSESRGGKGPTAEPRVAAAKGITVGDDFKPSDPMGLYAGADNPLAPKPQDLRPFTPEERRPNADGSYSTELSTTWQLPDGQWVNVPSLWMSTDGPKQFDPSDEAGILGAMQRWEAKTGQAFPRFASMQDAEASARSRSAAGGAAAGGTPEQASPSAAQQTAEDLNAKEPGRYRVMSAEEAAAWKADWDAKNQSTGLLGDASRLLASGTADLELSVREAIGAIPKVGKAIVKGLDAIDEWARGDGVSYEQNLKRTIERNTSTLTPETKAAREKQWVVEQEQPDGTVKFLPGPAWSDPRTYFSGAMESAPATIATMAPSALLARGAYVSALSTGVGERSAAATAARTATIAGGVSEGVVGGGQSSRSVREAITQLPRETLEQSAAIKALVDGGMSFDQAVNTVADDAATQAFIMAGVATAAFGGNGDRVLAKILTEGVGGNVAERVLGGAVRGAVAEGALEEAPQSAAQKAAENKAVQTVNPNQRILEGVPDAAAGGLAVGAMMGSGFGAAGGAVSPERAPEAPATAEQSPPSAATPAPAPAPQPPAQPAAKGSLAKALQEGQRRAAAARGIDVPVEAPEGAAAPVQAPTTGIQPTATVLVKGEGVEPFMARVDSIEGDEAVVFDSASGEVYQVPLANLEQIAPTLEDYTKQGEPAADDLPPPAAPIAGEVKTELPPAGELKPASEAFPGPPAPGQRVIVNGPDGQFAGRVDRYEDVDGSTEAVVVNDAGTSLQVPLDELRVSKLTKNEVEAQELRRNPPVEREAPAKTPLTRQVGDKTVELPDEQHARLYDLGRERFTSKMLAGASKLDMDRAMPAEQARIAEAFGVTPEAAGMMADDYRYRVERAGKEGRSKLAIKMHPVNERRLRQWQNDKRKADASGPVLSTDADWWDGELTSAERRALLEGAGVKRSERLTWGSLTPSIREKLLAQRTPVAENTADVAEDAADVADLDTVAHEAATSPRNDKPEPTEAQKKAGNYSKGHMRLAGLDISIENPEGSTRSGVSASGKSWSTTMKSHYGYIRGTVGRDKDHVDVFVKPGTEDVPESSFAGVFVIDQRDPSTGRFDEHKVMLGYATEGEARAAYLQNYTKGWNGLGAITETTVADFKRWLADGDTTKPFRAEQPVSVTARADRLNPWAYPWTDVWPNDDAAIDDALSMLAGEHDQPIVDAIRKRATNKELLSVIEQTLGASKASGNRYEVTAGVGPSVRVKLLKDEGKTKSVTLRGKDLADRVRSLFTNSVAEMRADVAAKEAARVEAANVPAAKLTHPLGPVAETTGPVDKTAENSVSVAREPTQPAAWGAGNKLVSRDRAEELRKRLAEKMRGQLNAGIDPEVLAMGTELAAFHIEAGARKFADFARAVAQDLGTTVEKLRPFLRAWYNGARDLMEDSGLDIAGTDNAETVRAELAKLQETTDEPAKLDQPGTSALEGTPSETVRRAEGSRPARNEPERSGQPDLFGSEPARGGGNSAGRSVADGEGDLSATPARKPAKRQTGKPVADAPDATGDAERSARDASRVEYPSSAATPAAKLAVDYTLTDADELGAGGQKTKFRNNVAAIQLLRELEAERRPATRDEQSVLAKWVGWGGLRQAFAREDGTVAQGWEKQAAELKELLSPDEYRAAEASTRNAHYTSPEVVSAIWDIVRRLGFAGGQVLEPSLGAGNFVGLMPGRWRDAANITGVELDHITGGIAKHLYPGANINAPVGFQNFTVPDGHFDLVIGNPPFGSERLYDPERRQLNKFAIHNFFFAKSIEALKPNGVLAMVVTNYFMDAADARARAFIAARANLLGAIRLPNNAFLKNAGTEVTTDIIVLQKRAEGTPASDLSWVEVSEVKDKEGRTVPLNRYFKKHPDMMLGEFGAYGTMYRGNEAALVAREDDDLPSLLRGAILKLPESVMDRPGAQVVAERVAVPDTVEDAQVGSVFLSSDGGLFRRLPDMLGKPQAEPIALTSDTARERVSGMVRVRDAFARLRRAQIDERATDDKVANLRKRLNDAYDAFVKKHGPINLDVNRRLFRDDPTWPQISALEEGFDKGVSAAVAKNTGETARAPSARKAPIFEKRTQQPYRRPTSATSAKDALTTVLADRGFVDLDAMSRLYGKSERQIIDELGPLLYRTPAGSYETTDQYLSGNVKQKLAEALCAADQEPAFRRNVAALQDVIPADIEPVDIAVKPGASWLPPEHVAAFADHIAGSAGAKAVYSPLTAKWALRPPATWRATPAAEAQWSTERTSVPSILEAVLNGQTLTIYDRTSDGKAELNQPATDAANEKAERVKAEWKRWLWEDDARRVELARLYNDTFNTDVLRKYDGAHLTLPGKVGDDIISLRPHQKNFVWRTLQSSTTLADHVVGAGKTFALIASIMEKRRIGQARKPMLTVPNHLVGQWAADFIKLYPGAKILAATKKDFEAENRKRLFARIATGDWDAVIVAHSSFGRIGISREFEEKFIREQISDLEASEKELRAESGQKSRNVAQLAKWREGLESKLKRLLDAGSKDEGLTFDELGVDALYVDEAHEFKNLAFATSQNRVAGLGNPGGSQKAADLYMKVLSVLERTGGHNIVFATGTPISNTMAEMYTMMRYLMNKGLRTLGVSHFDAWARQFGDIVTDWELSPSGQYKLKSRFAKFTNMPELMQRYLSFADVITNDDIKAQLAAIGKKLPLPQVKGGKPTNIVVERSPDQAAYIGVGKEDANGNLVFGEGTLVHRAENLPKKAEKGADNMLKVMSDARKAALDMRLIDPSYPDRPGSKLHIAADRIKALYDQWAEKKGTQLVFIDLSTPKKARAKEEQRLRDLVKRADEGDEQAQEALDKMSPDEFLALESSFSVYDDLRDKLIARGIPAQEIAFIHDANTDLQKEELFGKVRSGRIRLLFGSTAKMGAGTNVQNRIVALHHLDAPWRPSDLEQRDGRGIRQGNELYSEDPEGFFLEINRYATKNTLDARQWQTIEGKARFIQQVRKGGMQSREIEDIAGEAANAAEMKAAASGNPLILEEMDLRQKLRRLENQKSEHEREQYRIRDRARSMRAERERNVARLPIAREDAERAKAVAAKDFVATINGKTVERPSDMGEAILEAARRALKEHSEGGPLGTYGGFKLELSYNYAEAFTVVVNGASEHDVHISDVTEAVPTGVGMRVLNTIRSLPDVPGQLLARNEEIDRQLPALEKQLAPWADQQALDQVSTRHREVLDALRPKPKPAAAPAEPKAPEYSIAEEAPRRQLGLPKDFRTFTAMRSFDELKAHPSYTAAKAGDPSAAVKLVPDVVPDRVIEQARASFGPDTIYVAPHAEEMSGRNLIPNAMAHYLATMAGGVPDKNIVQVSRAFHTGAKPLDRLLGRPLFTGTVQHGRRYVLVDDVTVMGGTLAELADFIRARGGVVVGAITLVNASRSGIRGAPKQHVRTMEERYGDIIRQEFGIEPAALTGDEALVILASRDADSLRNRIATAAQERDRRLLREGVRRAEGRENQVSPSGWDLAGGMEQPSLSEAEKQEIRNIVQKVSGLDKVSFTARIELPNGAPGWGSNAPTTAGGFYDPAADAVTIAEHTGGPRTAYHEAFHRLQRLFLTDNERQVLSAETGRLRRIVGSTMGREGHAARMSQKELEAEAFAIYATGQFKIAPHKAVAGVWDRIARMLRQVRNFLAGRGFDTAESVFDRAAAGDTAIRPARAGGNGGREYSLTENRVTEELRGRLTDLAPTVLAAIPLNYFTELARPNMTAVGEYLRVKRLLDAYRGKKHAAADEIAQQWLKFARLGIGKDGKARAAKLADLMHEATLAGVDPSKTDAETSAKPGYAELRSRYLELPVAGRDLYKTVRDAYREQANELDKILIDNVRKAQEIAQRQAEEQYREDLARIDQTRMSDAAKKDAREQAEKAYKANATKAQWSMKARLTKMRLAFEASRVEEPYFPLARFGRYFVSVRDVDGTVLSFSRRERAADRDRLAADMRAAYPTAKVEVGVMEANADVRQAMDPRIIAEIETIVGGSGLDGVTMTTVLDQIWQRYLATMPDLSTRKRFIHRKGTAGFDSDALRAFSSHMFHAAHQMGRLKYGLELQELTNQAVDQARKSDDVTRGMTLANELKLRHRWVMNPTGSSVAQVMTSAAFVWYLGASPAAAVVNMTQTPMIGIPVLAGRFGSFPRAAAAILKASYDSLAGRGSVNRANLTADERNAMDAFAESGLIDRTQSHDLAGVGETGVDYSPLRAKIMGLISWAFHRTEVWNREVTALAAYRMARAAGQDFTAAIDSAHDLTWKTHFDYSNASRPRLMQNDFAKVLLVFRSYSINMLYRLFRDIHQTVKGESAQARREARYQVAGIVGMMSLLAGVTGTVGFNLAMALAGAVFGDDDDPMDFEQQFRKDVLDALGPELGGIVLNGAPGHYLGVDLTSRIGMADLWFRSPSRDLQGKDEFDYWVMNSLGASVSMLGDAWKGYSLLREGNTAKGIEALAPKWARDLLKSYRYLNEGVTNLRGDTIVDPANIDAWDAIAQAIGFTPAKVSETYDRNSALINAESRVHRQRRAAVNGYAIAARLGDADAKAEAMAAIKRFNASTYGRTMPITAETLRDSLRVRERNAAKREDGVLIENRRLGKQLREQLPERVY